MFLKLSYETLAQSSLISLNGEFINKDIVFGILHGSGLHSEC